MSATPAISASGWRTPLLVILAGCTIALLNFGVRSGFGLFLEPISIANGWGREVFAFGIAIQTVLWGFGQPFAGAQPQSTWSARSAARTNEVDYSEHRHTIAAEEGPEGEVIN